jgi:hypothetical protein
MQANDLGRFQPTKPWRSWLPDFLHAPENLRFLTRRVNIPESGMQSREMFTHRQRAPEGRQMGLSTYAGTIDCPLCPEIFFVDPYVVRF